MQGVRLLSEPAVTHGSDDLHANLAGVRTQCGRVAWLETIEGVIDTTGEMVQGETDCMACIAAGARP